MRNYKTVYTSHYHVQYEGINAKCMVQREYVWIVLTWCFAPNQMRLVQTAIPNKEKIVNYLLPAHRSIAHGSTGNEMSFYLHSIMDTTFHTIVNLS